MQRLVLLLILAPCLVASDSSPQPVPIDDSQQKWGMPSMDDLKKQAADAANAAKGAVGNAKTAAMAAALKASGLCPKIDSAILDNSDAIADGASKALADLQKKAPGVPGMKACTKAVSTAMKDKINGAMGAGGKKKTGRLLAAADQLGGAAKKAATAATGAIADSASGDICTQLKPTLKQAAASKKGGADYASTMKSQLTGTVDKTLEKNLKPLCPDLFKQQKWLAIGPIFEGEAGSATFSLLGFISLAALSLAGAYAVRSMRRTGDQDLALGESETQLAAYNTDVEEAYE